MEFHRWTDNDNSDETRILNERFIESKSQDDLVGRYQEPSGAWRVLALEVPYILAVSSPAPNSQPHMHSPQIIGLVVSSISPTMSCCKAIFADTTTVWRFMNIIGLQESRQVRPSSLARLHNLRRLTRLDTHQSFNESRRSARWSERIKRISRFYSDNNTSMFCFERQKNWTRNYDNFWVDFGSKLLHCVSDFLKQINIQSKRILMV